MPLSIGDQWTLHLYMILAHPIGMTAYVTKIINVMVAVVVTRWYRFTKR